MGVKNKRAKIKKFVENDVIIEKALSLFAEGHDRHEVAKRLGYANYKSVDMYFRRRNYRWNTSLGTYTLYEPPQTNCDEGVDTSTSLVRQITRLLSEEGKDPREAASQTGFSDIQQMADYMMERGYVWDCDCGNYVKSRAKGKSAQDEQDSVVLAQNTDVDCTGIKEPSDGFADYFKLLAFLQKHEDRLCDMLTLKFEKAVPRYSIADTCITKSFHIPVSLNKIIKEFARERNISQKDIITVALVDFLSKYGFEMEIERMLNTGKP